MRKTTGFSGLILGSALLFAFPYVSFSQARGPAVAAGFAARVDEYMQAQTRWRRFTGSILVAREGKASFPGNFWPQADRARRRHQRIRDVYRPLP
jgi:hypothetical protein